MNTTEVISRIRAPALDRIQGFHLFSRSLLKATPVVEVMETAVVPRFAGWSKVLWASRIATGATPQPGESEKLIKGFGQYTICRESEILFLYTAMLFNGTTT